MVVSNCLFDKIQNHLGEVRLSMFVGKGLDYINWCGTHSDCGQSLGCSVGKVNWALSTGLQELTVQALIAVGKCLCVNLYLTFHVVVFLEHVKLIRNSWSQTQPIFFNKAASFVLVSKTETSCTRSVCQFSGTQNKTEKIIPSQWKGDRLKIEHWHQHY